MYSGVINLNKPKGKTSHDMIYFARRVFGQKKVGHTGTLDPNATGVLPICLGSATKAADYIADGVKIYRAEIFFGFETDTCDICGEVTNRCDEFLLSKERFDTILDEFIGEITQVPPMYSAVKINGKKLYELARKGIVVERKPRNVFVYSIKNESFSEKKAVITVTCSKGTYIRTLCEDIGRKLGCMGCMGELERIQSGRFNIALSHTTEEIEALAQAGRLAEIITPTDMLFADFEKLTVCGRDEFKVKNGTPLDNYQFEEGTKFRIYGSNGEFLCISKMQEGHIKMMTSFW